MEKGRKAAEKARGETEQRIKNIVNITDKWGMRPDKTFVEGAKESEG